MKKVCFVLEEVEHYNIKFFDVLFEKLYDKGIVLNVYAGRLGQSKNEAEMLECKPVILIALSVLRIFGKKIVGMRGVWGLVRDADIVIFKQGKKYWSNYYMICFLKLLGKNVGVWGNCKLEYKYGVPLESIKVKKDIWWKIASKADVWFAYNEAVKQIVHSTGYPVNKIVSIDNTIDVKKEVEYYEGINIGEINKVLVDCGIKSGAKIGIFCSRIYDKKRIEFLLESLLDVKKRVDDFHFILIGDGPKSSVVKSFFKSNNEWFHWVGSKYGKEKVLYFKMSDFQLMPGLVGLHIVDSFALQTPLITTKNDYHSVEIEYLDNWVNGIITENNINSYVNAICRVCSDEKVLKSLIDGCNKAKEKYSIENKVDKFFEGITAVIN